jgi:hypothetical protein
VKIGRNEDSFTLKVGADGETTRAKNANKSGKLTLTLMQSAVSNEVLSALQAGGRASGNATFSVQVKDARGTSIWNAATAWISKVSDAEYAKEVTSREWVIETDELIPFVGSNNAAKPVNVAVTPGT